MERVKVLVVEDQPKILKNQLKLLAKYPELEIVSTAKGAYLAAVERGRWVLENYPQSEATRDALAVMVEGYLGLEMRDRARETLQVLIENAPNHDQLRGRTFRPAYVKAESLSA